MAQVNFFMLIFWIYILVFVSQAASNVVIPVQHIRTPQNIHIAVTLGGISHTEWVLEIGQVLSERGHNVSFVTTEPNLKYGKKYPDIHTISMGGHGSTIEFHQFFNAERSYSPNVMKSYAQYLRDVMEREYWKYHDIFSTSNASIALCDHVALPCMDAARMLDIPIIITTTMSVTGDTRAPFITFPEKSHFSTTHRQNLWQRLYERYYLVPRYKFWFRPAVRIIQETQQKLGIKPWNPLGRHEGTIKLINNFWGFESPRPVGPFVEYVGPIISRYYDALPDHLTQFMDTHSTVVYVAFGQMYAPNRREFETLLVSLLEGYELGLFDGLLWSMSMKSRANYPETIQTTRGTIYNVSKLFSKENSNIRFESWVPQFAVLDHAHCKLFITHGGAGSVHESLYNGVPMLVHPFASDQPSNADKVTDAGAALTIHRKTANTGTILDMLNTILVTKRAEFEYNSRRLQTLAQVRYKRKSYAADVIEETIYASGQKNNIWYRHEAVRHMPWWKATNWDVDLLAGALFLTLIYIIFGTAYRVFRNTKSTIKPDAKKVTPQDHRD